MLNIARCGYCQRRGYQLLPQGPHSARVVFQGVIPSAEDIVDQEVFSSRTFAGKAFSRICAALGVHEDEPYRTYSCFCHNGGKAPTPVELMKCRRYKHDEFLYLDKVRAWVLLGNSAIRQHLGVDFLSVGNTGFRMIETNGYDFIVLPALSQFWSSPNQDLIVQELFKYRKRLELA